MQKNRTGIASKIDKAVSIVILLTSFVMISFGVFHLNINHLYSIILIVFGAIAGIFSISDLKTYYKRSAVGKERLSKHLGAMLGATIAALTAFSVTNISVLPKIVVWLGPTLILSPIIVWWKYKIQKTKTR